MLKVLSPIALFLCQREGDAVVDDVMSAQECMESLSDRMRFGVKRARQAMTSVEKRNEI